MYLNVLVGGEKTLILPYFNAKQLNEHPFIRKKATYTN